MKKISGFIALVVAVVVLGAGNTAYADHAWGTYHWARTANPFTLKLADVVSSSWDSYLATASTDWSASSVLDTTIVAGSGTARTCKSVAGRVQVCNASYGNNGWLGIASIWADANGHITKGTAKMNDTYFNTATYNKPAWRRLVMCQEVAHTFGLDHQDETFNNVNLGTCMDYTDDPDGGAGGASATDASNEHPNQHDFDQLVTMYTHTDGYATVAATVANALSSVRGAMRDESDDDSEELGNAVGHDKKGRANRFERVQKNGLTKVTHVFWVP